MASNANHGEHLGSPEKPLYRALTNPVAINGDYECRRMIAVQHQPINNNQKKLVQPRATGRPFDPYRDVTGYRMPDQHRYSPPNLMGRSLNVAEEVEREKLISLGQTRTAAAAVCDNRPQSQCMDRASYNVGRRSKAMLGSIPKSHHISRWSTDAGACEYTSSPYVHKASPATRFKFADPKHQRKPAAYEMLPSSRARRNSYVSQTPDLVREVNSPIPSYHATYPQAVNADTSNKIKYPQRVSQQCLYEIPPTQQNTDSPTASDIVFDAPTADSTHYQDTNDVEIFSHPYVEQVSKETSVRSKPNETEMPDRSQFRPTFNESSISKYEPMPKREAPTQSNGTACEYVSGSVEMDELSAVEPPTKLHQCNYSQDYISPQRYDQHSSPDAHGSWQTKSYTNQISSAICGFAYNNSDNSANTDAQVSTVASHSAEPQLLVPVPVACTQETSIPNFFRCLANKLSTVFCYLSSFVMSQKPLDPIVEATVGDKSFNITATKECQAPAMIVSLGAANHMMSKHCRRDELNSAWLANRLRSPDVPRSFTDCSIAKKCGRVQFDSTFKSEVQDPRRAEIMKTQLENLVEDSYCPGLIQATLDGREDFNNVSLNITLRNCESISITGACEGLPPQDPMTLIEAFSIRIAKDRHETSKAVSEDATVNMVQNSIEKYFSVQTPSELNNSLKCLLLSEALAENDQMEYRNLPSFSADIQKNVHNMYVFDPEIISVCYIGHTKPIDTY